METDPRSFVITWIEGGDTNSNTTNNMTTTSNREPLQHYLNSIEYGCETAEDCREIVNKIKYILAHPLPQQDKQAR